MRRLPPTRVKLADVAFFQEGPGLRTHQFTSEGMKVINVTNILSDGSVDVGNTDKHISLTEFETRYSHFAVEENDVVLASSGNSYGKVGRIRIEHLPLMMNTSVIRFHSADRSSLHDDYLYAFLRSPDFLGQVNAFVIGGAQPNFGPSHLKQMTIPLPPLRIQERFASVLSAYDDLIENNRRRMALLEESARLLYQEWFVRLRFPGHEHTPITNGIPQGWKKVELKSFVNITHGFAFQGAHFSDSETSRILTTPGNFAIGGGFQFTKPKYYSEDGPLDSGYVLSPMDLIVTMTDLSKSSDTLGLPALVPRIGSVEFLHNQRVGKVVPIADFFPRCFLYCTFCGSNYRHHVVGAATGTSVKHTSPSRILAFSALMPTSLQLLAVFENLVNPHFQQMQSLTEANQRLRAARDLLLPRLMNGEIAV